MRNGAERRNLEIGFEVLTAVIVSMLVFCVVTSCGLVGRYKYFGGIYCLHLQDWRWNCFTETGCDDANRIQIVPDCDDIGPSGPLPKSALSLYLDSNAEQLIQVTHTPVIYLLSDVTPMGGANNTGRISEQTFRSLLALRFMGWSTVVK
jgi:hypothetical protein